MPIRLEVDKTKGKITSFDAHSIMYMSENMSKYIFDILYTYADTNTQTTSNMNPVPLVRLEAVTFTHNVVWAVTGGAKKPRNIFLDVKRIIISFDFKFCFSLVLLEKRRTGYAFTQRQTISALRCDQ